MAQSNKHTAPISPTTVQIATYDDDAVVRYDEPVHAYTDTINDSYDHEALQAHAVNASNVLRGIILRQHIESAILHDNTHTAATLAYGKLSVKELSEITNELCFKVQRKAIARTNKLIDRLFD